MKYLARILLVAGLMSMAFGFVSCRRISGDLDDTKDVVGLAAFQKSLRSIFLGAIAAAVGLYLRGKTPGNGSVSQLRVDLTLLTARFCRKCRRAFHPAQCARTKQLGFLPRLACPSCGAYLEQSGAKITVVGMLLLSAYFMPLADLVFPRVPDFLVAIGVISFLAGIPVSIVGLMRLGRQPGNV